jgi:malate synthase
VVAEKERESTDGFDGTWVAHPGLVPVAKDVFDRLMPQANQVHFKRDDVNVAAADLLRFAPESPITEAGLRTNINVSLQYIGAWLGGLGCVPINHLMEDAATAEISRSQIWQWIRNPKGVLADGRRVTLEMFREVLAQELRQVSALPGARASRFDEAAWLLDRLVSTDEFIEFLTEPAYELLGSQSTGTAEPLAA